ncbi:hypothetical protein L7H23_08730 [Sphingopyxis sp. BSN-002]|uniref:hypothetical protein n=1 Tax=Sphingopyxis sp. BSN-002 TaxID=2911495 RepID=UPI001EDC7654|nr:hypothetical protein [Sphingopyxis sp. BSN-002]UKK86164.1 hypothetical protein L7H23_08730 [Sphingopyxis sp. BSN-002]
MIYPLSEQKAKGLRERLSIPMERIEIYPEATEYCFWIKKISDFISSQGCAPEFAIQKYRGDFKFFIADRSEEYTMMFIAQFTPQELVFLGIDWMIGISSYPECEGTDVLEYAVRLYGAASILERIDDPAKSDAV